VGEEQAGFIVIYHDISDRVKYEEELQQQKEYYEALFLNTPAAVATVNQEGNVISWNPAAERLFGYTQQETIGKNIDALIAHHDSIQEEAEGLTEQLTTADVEHVHLFTKRV
jgi:PAS domain S-box-containing protein